MIASTWLLGLRRLRRNAGRALLAVVAIAAGTSLLVGVLIDRWSLQESTRAFTEARIGRAELAVNGPGAPAGLDEGVLAAVEAVDGVETAAPVVQAVTILEDAAGTETFAVVLGVDCRIEGVIGEVGCTQEMLDFAGNSDLFATSPSLLARLGTDGVLRSNAGRIPLDRAQSFDRLEAMNGGRVVALPLASAQRLFGRPGSLSTVLVVPESGADVATLRADLQEAVGEHNRVDLAGGAPSPDFAGVLLAMLLLSSLFALAVGAQLVHNVVSLSLEERRRDLAVATAIGATPRSLLAGVLAEAAVLGAAGGLLGVGGGILLAGPLVEGMSDTLDDMTGLRLEVHVPPLAIVVGVALGVVASVLAALRPARRAVGVDVSGELHGRRRRADAEQAARPWRALVCTGAGLGGVALTWVGSLGGSIQPWQPVAGLIGFCLAIVLLFRAMQLVAPVVLARAGRLPLLRDGIAGMAAANLAAAPKRTGVMVLAVGAAVGTGVVLGNTNASIVAGSHEFADELSAGHVWVSTLVSNNSLGVQAKVTPEVQSAIAEIEGVAAVHRSNGFTIVHPSVGGVGVSTVDPGVGSYDVFLGDPDHHAVAARGEVLIGAALARTHGWRPGDDVRIPTPNGMRTLRVGTVWGDPNFGGRGLSLSGERFDELFGSRPPSSLRVVPDGGVRATVLADRIEAAGLDPDLVVLDPGELAEDFTASIQGIVTPFAALQQGMLVVALIAVASTLLLVGVERQRERGVLVAIGMPPGGLGRMTVVEAGLVAVVGSVAAAVGGIAIYYAMINVSPVLTGLAAPFRPDLLAPVGPALVGTVVVLGASLLPAWRATRIDPVAALRYE